MPKLEPNDFPRGVRLGPPGVAWYPTRDKTIEAWMDERFPRKHSFRETVWLVNFDDCDHAAEHDPGPLKETGRAVLFGKGPSLDRWCDNPPEEPFVGITMAVNEAAHRTQPMFVVCIDSPCLAKRLTIPDGCRLITRVDRVKFARQLPLPALIYAPRDQLQVVNDASAAIGLRVLKRWGISRVLMVGFDGWDRVMDADYAPSIQEAGTPPRAERDWARVNQSIKKALLETGIEAEWWHRTLADEQGRAGAGADDQGATETPSEPGTP